MNLIDPLLVIFLLVVGFVGYFSGFSRSLGAVGSIFIGFAIAKLTIEPIFGATGGIWGDALDTGKMVTFLLVFCIICILIQSVIPLIDRRQPEDLSFSEKAVAGIFIIVVICISTGILLVFGDAYIMQCSKDTSCISFIDWLHTAGDEALLLPLVKSLASSILHLFF